MTNTENAIPRAQLHIAEQLAFQAAEVILAIRARGFATTTKSDQSPVTEADNAAEAVILAGLRTHFPHIPVIAEEEVASGILTTAGNEFWLVDPLDGTREFTAGRDDFAVCIGLIRDGKPILGVVGIPARGVLYSGIVGLGAEKVTATSRTKIACRDTPAAGITVVASRSHGNNADLETLLADHKVAELINIGSAMKFCLVAEGLADFYPRFGRTMEWDTAAAQAVVEAAGGVIHALPGGEQHATLSGPLRYGKPGFDNPHFVCTARANLLPQSTLTQSMGT